MKILKDGFRADMERIKRELTALQGVSIHVGILGNAGSDILMIAGVHELSLIHISEPTRPY